MDKEVKYVNLQEMQYDPEGLLVAKMDIEANTEKSKLVDFITKLNMVKVYTYKKQMISFSIVKGNEYDYVFYMLLQGVANVNSKLETEALDKFKEKIESINYDLTKLTKKSSFEIIETGNTILDFGEYFIINNEFYV